MCVCTRAHIYTHTFRVVQDKTEQVKPILIHKVFGIEKTYAEQRRYDKSSVTNNFCHH